jgi:acyl-CoA thioesterase II
VRSEADDPDAPGGTGGTEAALEQAIDRSLEGLLHALELEPVGDDHFRVRSEPGRFDRVFGGQTVAQALAAAGETVDGKDPHSLHAYFVEAGAPDEALELTVERVRDGRSMSTRRVSVTQGDRTLLVAMASFHANPAAPELATSLPSVPDPDDLPRLQHWVHRMAPDRRERTMTWVDRPPPLELRIGEAPNFMGGPSADGSRSHWMRVPGDVGDAPLLHAALLAYASDYLLLDMAYRSHPERIDPHSLMGFSLDHAIWFHRPVRFDRWHLHTQETIALTGHRALVRGAIQDADGHSVASVMQEVLVRPTVER